VLECRLTTSYGTEVLVFKALLRSKK